MLYLQETMGFGWMLMRSTVLFLLFTSVVLAPSGVNAGNSPAATSAKDAPAVVTAAAAPEKESPWLVLPLFSSNPKLGTSLGALGLRDVRVIKSRRVGMPKGPTVQ